MAQTSYEDYLATLMGNINPQGGMVSGQASAPPPMAMPDISAIQAAVQGVQNVNQGYVAPQLSDLNLVRQQATQKQIEKAGQNLNLPQGMLSSFTSDSFTGGDSSTAAEDTAWSKMSESEKAAWVQANPQSYILGKTIASALLPGGMVLASMQDPYMNMSLIEYMGAKAADAVDGGVQPPAPVEKQNIYSVEASPTYESTSSSSNDSFDYGGAGTGYGNVSGYDAGSYW